MHVPIMWCQLEGSAAAASPSQSRAIRDPKHWRHRAEEARAMAKSMTNPEAKLQMLNVAADYEKLAQGDEERSAGVCVLDYEKLAFLEERFALSPPNA